MIPLKEKEDKLKEILKSFESVAIAYSGGVDSSLLAYIASKCQINMVLITAKTPFLTKKEFDFISTWTKKNHFTLEIIKTNPLKNNAIVKNSKNRCYFCKKMLMKKIITTASKYDINIVVDGTNIDDLGEYRPGLLATQELGVKHPFVMADISKKEIRTLAKKYYLENADMPAQACMATRIPYGTELKNSDLRKIEKAEDIIKSLGIKVCRVRKIGNIAKIETEIGEIKKVLENRDFLVKTLKLIGFLSICIDLNGYKSGTLY